MTKPSAHFAREDQDWPAEISAVDVADYVRQLAAELARLARGRGL